MSGRAARRDARAWPGLWERAEAARHRLLLLDFDGTLAPFHVDRAQAALGERTHSLLASIAADPGTRVGIVSGRPLEELEARFHDVPADLVGEHGWEERRLGHEPFRHPVGERTLELLRRCYDGMRRHAPAGRVERKRTGVVLHSRGLTEREIAEQRVAVDSVWAPLQRHAELELRQIDGGWELRARGRHKGTAVSALVADHARGGLAVYLGDDETDEDAFAAVARSGFAIRVGTDARSTRAHAHLPDVDAVVEWLEIWRQRIGAAALRE